MADLKTTIAQTENLKNKVKLAKDRINETVVRGGSDFKSLAETPKRITEMLGQYKKIAILKGVNAEFVFYDSNMPKVDAKVEIDLSSVEFEPKNYIFDFEGYDTDYGGYGYGDGNFLTKDTLDINHNFFSVYLERKNVKYDKVKKKLTLYGEARTSYGYTKIINVTLIG